MRNEKSYTGDLMVIGTSNEDAVFAWLKTNPAAKGIIDFREFRLAQRIDVDCGIETIDGKIVLAEIKSDKWINETGNLLFENHRINHYVKDKWFYLGWGWRSPARTLIVRNPWSCDAFIFDFDTLRTKIGAHIGKVGKGIRVDIVETDDQKTTFNYLIPMSVFRGMYKKVIIPRLEANPTVKAIEELRLGN